MQFIKLICFVVLVYAVSGVVEVSGAQSPAAYVYVSQTPKNSSVNEIEGFAAASNGSLAPVPGSPYTADVTSMAVNGVYLFCTNANGVDIDSYRISPNGALTLWAQTNVASFNPKGCGFSGPLVLDHTGATLYDLDYRDDACANNDYRSLRMVKSNGELTNLGTTEGNDWLTGPITFIGGDQYAYTASCLGNMFWGIWGYQRESNGLLKDNANFSVVPPKAARGEFYCPSLAAADRTNHVAISMQAVQGGSFSPVGPPQIATFTAASNGDLTTTSTGANMPAADVVNVTDLSMAPGGKLLAVSGTGGLQIFHFNGASPATRFTGLLTRVEIDQMFWDKQNHLYAISRPAGKLFVFTITPTSVSQAPGSPHAIVSPQNLIVQPPPWW